MKNNIESIISELSCYYPVLNELKIEKNDSHFFLSLKNKKYNCTGYKTYELLRLLAAMISDEKFVESKRRIENICTMIDVSRNAIFKVDYLKSLIRKMALMGYNQIMLYTEDVYEIDDQPYFGYMRGKYSKAELKEVVNYAKIFDIEVIPCIQVLGHLGQFLRWSDNAKYLDRDAVLCVEQNETYELIESMIRTVKDIFETDKIHIGMDEAFGLGTGNHLKKYGYNDAFNLFNDHLAKVLEICKKYGYETPMIWSDMYYRIGSKKDDYYDVESHVPDNVINAVPKEVELVYWDYYHEDYQFYDTMIKNHQRFNNKLVFAAGIWTWAVPIYEHKRTVDTASHSIEAAVNNNFDTIIFTMWNDDGAYCDFESSLLGLNYVINKIYDTDINDSIFATITNYNLKDIMTCSKVNSPYLKAAGIMWDDPLYGILWNNEITKDNGIWNTLLSYYTDLCKELNVIKDEHFTYNHSYLLSKYLEKKISIRKYILENYDDKQKLRSLEKEIDEIKIILENLKQSYRTMWLSRNKPYGLEVIQIRLAGMIERYEEFKHRINDLINGEISTIEELMQTAESHQFIKWHYRNVALTTIDF